jgi:hypothetical protein
MIPATMNASLNERLAALKLPRAEFDRHHRPLDPAQLHVIQLCNGDPVEMEITQTIERASAAFVDSVAKLKPDAFRVARLSMGDLNTVAMARHLRALVGQ